MMKKLERIITAGLVGGLFVVIILLLAEIGYLR